MKANYLKRSLWLAAILLTSLCTKAQTGTTPKIAYDSESDNLYYRVHDDGTHRITNIKTEFEDKVYRVTMVDEKLTELYVSGEKIAEADWGKYSSVISQIRAEIKEQEKRDAEQAIRNQEQAKRNAEQEVRNREQEKKNAEQAVKNQEQGKRNAEQVIRNQEQDKKNAEQAIKNKEQEEKNAEQVIKNQEQAKKNAEQAIKNQEQEKRNAEQAIRNQEQAKRNEEQAKRNEQMMKELTDGLVSDKIIPDTGSLRELKINEFGMSVNGVKQPDEVFKKYQVIFKKYNDSFEGSFNYSRDGFIKGQ